MRIPSLSRQRLRSITIRVNAVVVEAERRRVCGAAVALVLYNIIITIVLPLALEYHVAKRNILRSHNMFG